eukprot:SAG22_NODE_687_length_7913_cov_2.611851_5_plen_257_part_00
MCDLDQTGGSSANHACEYTPANRALGAAEACAHSWPALSSGYRVPGCLTGPDRLLTVTMVHVQGKMGERVRTKALSFCCVSTVFLSKTAPFLAVLHNTQAAEEGGSGGTYLLVILIGSMVLAAAYFAAKNSKVQSYSDWGSRALGDTGHSVPSPGGIQTVSAVPTAAAVSAYPVGHPGAATAQAVSLSPQATIATATTVAAATVVTETSNPLGGGGAAAAAAAAAAPAAAEVSPEAFLRNKRTTSIKTAAVGDDDI